VHTELSGSRYHGRQFACELNDALLVLDRLQRHDDVLAIASVHRPTSYRS